MANANKKYIKSLKQLTKRANRLTDRIYKLLGKIREAQLCLGEYPDSCFNDGITQEHRAVVDAALDKAEIKLAKRVTKVQAAIQKASDDLQLILAGIQNNPST